MGLLSWIGDRVETGVDAVVAAHEQGTGVSVTGDTQAEREAAVRKAGAESWEYASAPVGASLGVVAGVVAGPEAGKAARQAWDNIAENQKRRSAELYAAAERRRRGEFQTDKVSPFMRKYPKTKKQLLFQVAHTAAALVVVESNGNPDAISPSGSYVGLLQMGKPAAADIGLPTNQVLIGDARLALVSWLKYNILYKRLHNFQPLRMAILWKGGPGTLKKFNGAMSAGASERDAIAGAAPASWNLAEYVRRFSREYEESI